MNHIKNFIQFINEGAWYVTKNRKAKTYLSVKNNPRNANELLKTVNPNNLNFSERGIANIKTYFGLYPDPPYLNNTPDGDRAKEFIMDPLKDDNFLMAPGESLEDFFKYTFTNNIQGNIDYIVTMGSSKGLVKKMGDTFLNIYPNATIISIPKIKYTDAMQAIDWESYNRKIESELAMHRGYYEEDVINRRTGKIKHKKGDEKPRYSPTMQRVEPWIDAMVAGLLEMDDPSFEIRSSGEMGGIRSALRPKYNTATEAFIGAVHHCGLGDNNGNFGRMLIIDDNINQGVDLRDISNKMIEILSGIIDITKNITEERLKNSGIFSNISKESIKKIGENVFCYALYNFGPSGKKYEPNEKYKSDLLKKSFINAIADIKETSVENIERKIWRPTGFLSKDPTPIAVSSAEREILYDKVLDYATEEFEKISQDPRNEIRSDLSKILDNRIDKILLVVDEEPEKEIPSRYPDLDYIKIGDELINKNSGDNAVINNINRQFGTFDVRITSGSHTGMITKSMNLQILDPNWTRGGFWKLKNQR